MQGCDPLQQPHARSFVLVQLFRMTGREKLILAAGILEGEGCFTVGQRSQKAVKNVRKYPRLQLAMSDEDVVRKVAATFRCGSVYPRPPRKEGYLPYWQWVVVCRDAERIMKLLLPFMGKRRSKRIREVLRDYRS
jgi:hypothetical protein